ncbi:MerR family transcriptional regulator [Novosphingobium naphthalenivorans]|uniref:MerR family transcriptional regulator n=1 Tax=Novosphingobium naphthalenivorans TaxID=273168 RepID=UPI0008349C24|nr:MerR family transcriptional regulator [Novosphingobium naphthalenivorans]
MNGLPEGLEFNDGKAADALRTIGEVAQALGIRQHVLRYWEEQFPALQPIKRSGGRRYYRPQDVALIVEIDRLVHREGYTLRGACKAVAGKSATPVLAADAVSSPVSGSMDRGIRDQLVAIRGQLAEALATA